MRDRETIDSELRLLALRGRPSSQEVDELLDERLGHRAAAPERKVAGVQTQTRAVAPRKRKGALRRFGPLALVPLSLLAVGAAFAMTFGGHNEQSADTAEVAPPAISETGPPAPPAQVPVVDITDRVFIDVLNHDSVPVPSREYATTHAHAVCGFLKKQPYLADAVHFVQQSTVWDADQSTHFAVGAVVSYCPEYESAGLQPQPGLQNSLSDLQAIQRDLRDIQGGLQGIRDRLPTIPGE